MAQGKIKSVKSTLFFFYVGELTMKLLKAVKPLFKGGNFIKKKRNTLKLLNIGVFTLQCSGNTKGMVHYTNKCKLY